MEKEFLRCRHFYFLELITLALINFQINKKKKKEIYFFLSLKERNENNIGKINFSNN